MTTKKIYFSAGPAKVISDVMERAQEEFLNYNGTDISVGELSHRSKTFESISATAESDLRKLLKIPENYSVIFMQGGAKLQFDLVPMNISEANATVDYIVNGSWSKMAAGDAKKHQLNVKVQEIKSDKSAGGPLKEDLVSIPGATYRYYCDNETIQGIEFPYVPESGADVPLVCDMTSNFLSRPVDVSKFGIIFASAQKNSGISGVTVVIVRNDLLGKERSYCPTTLVYKTVAEHKSLYNTPPTFAIYISGLCYKWMLEKGGLEAMDKFSKEKSSRLYETIDNSGGFYYCPIRKDFRSRMNVVFLLAKKELDAKFLEEASSANLFDIKGHRSVGGFRASLYHGITMDDVQRLVDFMDNFRQRYSS